MIYLSVSPTRNIFLKNIPLLHLFLISFSGKQSMSRSSGLCALLYTRRKGTVLNCMHTKQQSSCPSIYPVSRKKCFIYILKGLRPLCRHPVTNRLRMRGIYCSLNPYIYQRTYSGGAYGIRTRELHRDRVA